MRFVLISIMAVSLPCLALSAPEAQKKTPANDHANQLANDIVVDQKTKLKTVVPGSSRVVLVRHDAVKPTTDLLSKKKQSLTIERKKSATLIHISNPR